MKKICFCLLLPCFLFTEAFAQQPSPLPEWKTGFLDIHFISTGVGNCAFAVLPDGTTMLIDAGELNPTSPRVLSPRNTRRYPNYSQLGFQWQADYITAQFPKNRTPRLDYALISHYHNDHFGGMYPGIPQSTTGEYYLSGITGVGELLPIGKLVDRGDNYPYDLRAQAEANQEKFANLRNYWHFIAQQEQHNGLVHESLAVGSDSQFILLHSPDQYPDFSIRNIHANGTVWSGNEHTPPISRLPDLETIERTGVIPGENTLSCGILIQYGVFSFFTGGDIQGKQPDFMEKPDWYDMESAVAPVVGEVDVTTTNHHANRDAMTPFYLSNLRPRVIIQEVWSSDHPGHEALLRMTSRSIWPDDRDLFATNMLEANRLVIGNLLNNSYQASAGHIVLRVMSSGAEYFIYILNHLDTSRHVTAQYGPYRSKP